MAVKTAAIFDPLVPRETATGAVPHCYDVCPVADEAVSNRRSGTAVDKLSVRDIAKSLAARAVDNLQVSDLAFRGKFGSAVDMFTTDDRTDWRAVWGAGVDVIVTDDEATALTAKASYDALIPVEYLVAEVRSVRRAVDILRAHDAAISAQTACERSDQHDFILSYAPYGDSGPQQTVILPPPLPADIAKVDISRIIRRSRGNDLELSSPYGYRTPSQTVVFLIDEALKELLQLFVEFSTGQKIRWRDHHGYLHTGIIADPSTPYTETKDGLWRVQLEFIEVG